MDCPICNIELCTSETVIVRKKGIETLIKFSNLRNDGLYCLFQNLEEIRLHTSCRKKYIKYNAKGIYKPLVFNNSGSKNDANNFMAEASPSTSSKVKDSVDSDFPFKDKCFFCAEDIGDAFLDKENKKPSWKRSLPCQLKTEKTKHTIIDALSNNLGSITNEVIIKRIKNINLVTAMARYHRKCYLECIRPKKGTKRGRPEAGTVSEAMEIIYEYIDESNDPQFSLTELKDLLGDYTPDDRTILDRLHKKYEDRIHVTQIHGQTIITLKDAVEEILAENWYFQKEKSLGDEKLRLVKKAAQIIREDICLKIYQKDVYPAPNIFLEKAIDDVPKSLELFLKTLIGKRAETDEYKRKWLSVAHAIILLLRPKKFLSCILTALAVTLKKNYGSKLLINFLSRLGFCASYAEANVFEVSAINFNDYESVTNQNEFVQFVFDNADANIDTIDGKNTFHALGGIQCTSPLEKNKLKESLPRVNNVPSAEVIGSFGHIPLKLYNKRSDGFKNIVVDDYDIDKSIVPHITDILWLYGKVHNIPDLRGWNGFMQNLRNRDHFEISEIKALPFINAPPSNLDTINTSIITASQRTAAHGQITTFVTFDQPLYAKAREMIASSPNEPFYKNVVIRIGGFHLLMSYMGSIGFAMAGSGLKELWSIIYAPNSVNHMLTGHAYARAIRAHQLTYLALAELIFQDIYLSEEEVYDIESVLYDENIKEKDLTGVKFQNVSLKFEETLQRIESKSATAKLWISYFRMVCLIKKIIEAERSGHFNLHLETVENMLPVLVATGHFNYGKSLITYIKDMKSLKETMPPTEFEKFTTGGLFTVRRTDKFWSGVWTDMVIEQSLMRTMKVAGGLTRGRSITDSVLAKWILSMPLTQKVEESLESFCDLNKNADDIHTDSTTSRMARDKSDVLKLLNWLHEHPPFRNECNKIVSLSTGVAGDDKSINCHEIFDVGKNILKKRCNTKLSELTYTRKERVLSLATINSSVKSDDFITTPIDPMTIFQRISFLKKDDKDMKDYFQYELAPYPLSLFDDFSMRKSNKSALYDLFEPIENIDFGKDNEKNVHYVIDGGHLLHKVIWRKGDSYDGISLSIIQYLKKHYGSNITCVFDGYDSCTTQNCTKTIERLRRSSRRSCADIIFDGSMAMTTSQEDFLTNDKNKSRFIDLLTKHLKQNNITVRQCQGDADADIVLEAFDLSSTNQTVVVVGDDVDLLVLMTAFSQDVDNVYFFKPSKGKQPKKVFNASSFIHSELKSHILILHAFGGCDTTSALYNIGKKKYFNVVNRNPILKTTLNIFKETNASHNDITKAGEQFMAGIYGGDVIQTQNLNVLRYEKFARSLTKHKLNLASLPPTVDATHQHSLRVYHQVQLWLRNHLDPKEYGWILNNDILVPVKTLLPPAPEFVLKMIFCRCKTNCGSQCGCRKSGIKCSDICENCKGQSCTNRSENFFHKDSETEQESDEETITENLSRITKKRKII